MISFNKLSLLLLLIPFAASSPVASPESSIEKRQVDTGNHCGQWDVVTAGPYSLLLDQWGISGASGSDCASIQSLSGTTVAWKTTWNWSGGGGGVKTYTNIQLNSGIGKQLSAIRSIPASWRWSQSSSGSIVANIAYDLFTSTSAGGANVNEIMIWLANYNAGPISAVYGSDGKPVPVATVSLAGYTWNVYKGSNGANQVFSFLTSNGAAVTNFSGDLNLFLKYLTQSQGVSSSQYLKTAQGGTEATSGSATLTSSAYSMVIN